MADEEASRAAGGDSPLGDEGAGGLDAIREATARRDAEVWEAVAQMRLQAQGAWKAAHPDWITSDNATRYITYLHQVIASLVTGTESLVAILIGNGNANHPRSEDRDPPGTGEGGT